MRHLIRLLSCLSALAFLLAASSAEAQYRKYAASQPTIGEDYHVEVAAVFWNPTPELLVSSESLGIVGSQIDGVNDLGMSKTRFTEWRFVLRPAKKHKFRLDYIPIKYDASTTLHRDITFNGILYKANLPVNSTLDWKAYHFSYEYDFLYRPKWYLGLVLQAKYTDVNVDLVSPIDHEYAHARAPIPAVGGVLRVYPVSGFSITGEFTGFKLPSSIDKEERYEGKYLDFDLYATVNLTKNFGAQFGYRRLHVNYRAEEDTGDFQLKGLYFGGVVRF